jgi:hypothetical protein
MGKISYLFCGKPWFPRTPLPRRETKVSPTTPSFSKWFLQNVSKYKRKGYQGKPWFPCKKESLEVFENGHF